MTGRRGARESAELLEARRQLALAEERFSTVEAEQHLDEGLWALETLATNDGDEAGVAANLGAVYVERVGALIEQALTQPDVPEPELKRLFRLARLLEGSEFADADAEGRRQRVASRWVDGLLEGYSDAEKQEIIERLMAQMDADG